LSDLKRDGYGPSESRAFFIIGDLARNFFREKSKTRSPFQFKKTRESS